VNLNEEIHKQTIQLLNGGERGTRAQTEIDRDSRDRESKTEREMLDVFGARGAERPRGNNLHRPSP